MTATIEPTTDPTLLNQGIFAYAVINLSGTPEYRPRDVSPCAIRRVCIDANANLSTTGEPVAVIFNAGVYYDTGASQFYTLNECAGENLVVNSTTPTNYVYQTCTNLQKNRILIVYLQYATKTIPVSGSTVVYTPPVAPNVTVSVFNDNKEISSSSSSSSC